VDGVETTTCFSKSEHDLCRLFVCSKRLHLVSKLNIDGLVETLSVSMLLC